ncbi:MAG: triose-phosphate isomerase [Clostridia bacterium]|nr:triose-phosphate isomerase [Clostridia bacterium]MBR2734996.1 triose-phosphate isomerase [Clostridia bacterium]
MKKIIAANWKMNKTVSETKDFLRDFKGKIQNEDNCEIIVFPPFTSLVDAVRVCENTNIRIGAQNCHCESSGAFTGEVSAEMVRDIAVDYVICGHSERRKYFFETDEIVNKKIHRALENNLKVIFCVGESLEIRENGKVNEWIAGQIKNGLKGISKENLKNITVAYEPIWAIGTGKAINTESADGVAEFIKKCLADNFGAKTAVLYGGSVKPSNASDFINSKNIDGLLVGGASLDAESFAEIVFAAR